MSDKEEDRSSDMVTDEEREIAQNALAELKKKKYASCLQQIAKLENRTTDFKVAHNKAVVEYYKSDFKKTETFQKNLTALCNQFSIKIDKLDDVDHCTTHYNQALLLFHQRQYTAALKIMEKVYKFIEPMEDTLAKQVSLLAIELQLSVRQPDKAITLINYFENQILNGNANVKDKDKAPKEKNSEKKVDPQADEYKSKLTKYKIRCNLQRHLLKASTSEFKLLSAEKKNPDVLFLAANYEYMRGNVEEAINLLTSIPKDCLLYGETGESSTVMFYNNMGIIHHVIRKPNLACYYFRTALKEDIALTSSGSADKPLYTLGGSKYHEIIYNLGISLLYSGKPTQAFDCLIIAVRRYHRNSRLWLRIAECCIMLHKESNDVDFNIQKKQKEIVVETFGKNESKKAVLNTNLSKDRKYSTESQSYAIPVPSLEFASLCLRNAFNLIPSEEELLPIPLFLIPGVTPPAPPPSPGTTPSNPLKSDGIAALKNHILATSAYVGLCLGDYIIALEHARTLLEQTELSPGHKLLGNLYAAEALILLDKISEALDYLNPENIKDVSFRILDDSTSNKSKIDECQVTNPDRRWLSGSVYASAQSVLQYNIAVAKTIRGQLDQAAALLKQIWQQSSTLCRVPAHIIMLVIYIELQLGHADIARNLIKKYAFQHRISG